MQVDGDRYDAIVVGAGHNGLVCACYLAKAGLDVAVVERASHAGGCIMSRRPEGLPGYTLDLGGLDHGRLAGSPLIAELELERYGLRLIPRPIYAGAIFPGGHVLSIARDVDATCASIARFSPTDAAAYRRFVAASSAVLSLIAAASDGPPPSFAALLRLGSALPAGTRLDACLRLFMQSPRAVLDEWFESTELKALIANYATFCQLPPWQTGAGYLPGFITAAHGGQPARAHGGSGAFIASLVSCLRAHGGTLLTGRAVTRVQAGRTGARGVALEDGTTLHAARAVVSAIDARRLILDLLPPDALPPALYDEARRIKVAADNVGEMSMGVALSSLPDFGPELVGAALEATLYVAPTPRHVEEAFLDIMRGELPARPALMWALPSTTDPTLAPPGAHTLWAASFVPWQMRDGCSWDDAKEEMADRVLAALAEYAPGLPGLVRGRIVLSPLDWARHTGNVAGSADHVDQTLDQMLGNRPSPHLSRYRTPLPGLYLTGAGTHPGGGISGIPGRNTARVVLRDLDLHRRAGMRSSLGTLLNRTGLAWRGWRALDRLDTRAARPEKPRV